MKHADYAKYQKEVRLYLNLVLLILVLHAITDAKFFLKSWGNAVRIAKVHNRMLSKRVEQEGFDDSDEQ